MYVQEVIRIIYIVYFIGVTAFMFFFIRKVRGKR